LANEEATGHDLGVYLARLLVHDRLLGLNNSTGLTLIIYTNNSVAQLEFTASASGRKRLQDRELALAIDSKAVVEVGHSGNVDGLLAAVEIGDFLVSELEGW
jgi:hypothetical protein